MLMKNKFDPKMGTLKEQTISIVVNIPLSEKEPRK